MHVTLLDAPLARVERGQTGQRRTEFGELAELARQPDGLAVARFGPRPPVRRGITAGEVEEQMRQLPQLGVAAPTLDALAQELPGGPGLVRFVTVTGPRIDPSSLRSVAGAEVHGFLPDLTDHLAARDVALTQGGLTTCMELTALRKPFLYVPLQHHFERNFHVRHRLEQYRAGTCVDYGLATDPDALAAMLVKELGRDVDYRAVETDGAARAAALLADLL
ncbi:MAG: glycosyltransferase [Knoellia sp.]